MRTEEFREKEWPNDSDNMEDKIFLDVQDNVQNKKVHDRVGKLSREQYDSRESVRYKHGSKVQQ